MHFLSSATRVLDSLDIVSRPGVGHGLDRVEICKLQARDADWQAKKDVIGSRKFSLHLICHTAVVSRSNPKRILTGMDEVCVELIWSPAFHHGIMAL